MERIFENQWRPIGPGLERAEILAAADTPEGFAVARLRGDAGDVALPSEVGHLLSVTAGEVRLDPDGLTLDAGRWTCLLGPSGVGKTTVLRMIAGLESGAEFGGTITASDGAPLPPRIAWMAQEDLLLPWATVRENVTLGARLRGDPAEPGRVDALLAEVGLTPFGGRGLDGCH